MRTASPFIVGLRRRFGSAPSTHDGSYCSFTTAFDQVVDAGDLPSLLGSQTPDEANSFDEAVARFDKTFLGERVTIGAAGAELIRGIRHALPEEERAKTVVSFLIDHSGSMRGIRMLAALLAVDGAVDALTNAGIVTEVLGFTTSSWKGGNSRRAWRWAGKPRNPGRLCDLRHVIYAAADRSAGIPWHLRFALRPDLLHENIDGEALSWAASRLDAAIWDHRVICMISDGAPVDDSTLLANDDRFILMAHLEKTEQLLRADGIVIGSLLIGGEHYREPQLYECGEEPEAAGLSLIKLVQRALIPATSQQGPT